MKLIKMAFGIYHFGKNRFSLRKITAIIPVCPVLKQNCAVASLLLLSLLSRQKARAFKSQLQKRPLVAAPNPLTTTNPTGLRPITSPEILAISRKRLKGALFDWSVSKLG